MSYDPCNFAPINSFSKKCECVGPALFLGEIKFIIQRHGLEKRSRISKYYDNEAKNAPRVADQGESKQKG